MKNTKSISINTVLAVRGGGVDYSKELPALEKTSILGTALILREVLM
jgi:hypothetical protein